MEKATKMFTLAVNIIIDWKFMAVVVWFLIQISRNH